MSPILLWLKIFILTILSRSECFVYSNSGIMSWARVWRNMNTVSNDINLKSSCPWTIVRGTPQLLHIPEKERHWCKNCCIDLNQSNASHLIINPRGQCRQMKIGVPCTNEKVVVGYTCVYDATIPTDKRNAGHGPIVNGDSRHLQTGNINAIFDQTKTLFDNSKWDRKSSVKPPSSHTTIGNIERHLNQNQVQNNKYPDSVHQYRVPPFSDNAQFRNPPFLQNNNAQFRHGFSNALNFQLRPQAVIPVFIHSQRNLDYDGKNPDDKVDENYDTKSGRNQEFKDNKDAQYQAGDEDDSISDNLDGR